VTLETKYVTVEQSRGPRARADAAQAGVAFLAWWIGSWKLFWISIGVMFAWGILTYLLIWWGDSRREKAEREALAKALQMIRGKVKVS